MTNPNTKTQLKSVDQKFLAGLQRHFKSSKTIAFGGRSYTYKELVDIFQASIDAANASDVKYGEWLDTVKAHRKIEQATMAVRRGFRKFVIALLGETSSSLIDFGIKPRKKTKKLTLDEKTAALKKVQATREARHTMGKRQKRKVVGAAGEDTPAAEGKSNGTSGKASAA